MQSNLVNVGVGVHDLQCTGPAERLFYVRDNTHPGIPVDLQHHEHLCLVSLIELFTLLGNEVLYVSYLLEGIIELDLRLCAVQRLKASSGSPI